MKSRACCFVYGCGNASRRLIHTLRLLACRATASTSERSQVRTSHVFRDSRIRHARQFLPHWMATKFRVFVPSWLNNISLAGRRGSLESIEREWRHVDAWIAADDEVGQDAARRRRVLKAVAAEAVDQKHAGHPGCG